MQLTYKVRGEDGKEYGPVTLEQLTAWVREGRVLGDQQLQRSDMEHWAAAGEFTELKAPFGAGATPNLPPAISPQSGSSQSAGSSPVEMARVRSAASSFHVVAALSLINMIVAFAGGGWRFLFGLGVTHFFDAVGSQFASSGKLVALVLDLMAAGLLVVLGLLAGKRHAWAFVVGLILLALDGAIQVLGQDWIGVAFHGYVLFRLFQGFQACRQANAG